MRQKFLLWVIGCLSLCNTSVVYAAPKNLLSFHESYGVELKAVPVKKKGTVNISTSWEFKPNPKEQDYIDSNLLVNDIKRYLRNYASFNDYWEVINHKLGDYLQRNYPQLASISIKMEVPASSTDPYSHYSKVFVTR